MPARDRLRRRRVSPLAYVLLASLLAVLFGFSIGLLYACKFELIDRFMLDGDEAESIMGTFMLGAVVGSFLGGRITYDAGRRLPLVGSFALGAVAQSSLLLSPAFSSFLVSEFAVGGAFGIFVITVFIFTAEIAEPGRRGGANMCVSLMLVIGMLAAVLCGGAVYDYPYAFAAVILAYAAAAGTACCAWLPESPRWLALSGFSDAALSVLIGLRHNISEAARELSRINECGRGQNRGVALFLHSGSYRRSVWFLILISVLTHLSGYAVFPYMSTELVSDYQRHFYVLDASQSIEYNYDFLKAAVAVVLLGALSVLLTIDRIGRKKLILGSVFLAELDLVILYFLTGFSGEWGMMFLSPLVLIYIYAAFIGIFVFFSTSLSELLPLQGRELGVALIFFINFVALMSSTLVFDFLVAAVGLSGFFAMDLLFGALLFALIYHSMPEMRGSSLESQEQADSWER